MRPTRDANKNSKKKILETKKNFIPVSKQSSQEVEGSAKGGRKKEKKSSKLHRTMAHHPKVAQSLRNIFKNG